MAKHRGQRKSKVVNEDLDEIKPDLVNLYFDEFLCGDYEALIPLGFACLGSGCRATAYAAWYFAVLKGVQEAMPLAVKLSQRMSVAELLVAEADVNTLLPRINRLHCDS